MEIKYTIDSVDSEVFGENEVVSLFGDSSYLAEKLPEMETFKAKSIWPVGWYLKFGADAAMRKVVKDMISELEIDEGILGRRVSTLSTSEYEKVAIIKLCTSKAKCIVLENLDTYFNYKDMMRVIKNVKSHLAELDKTIILTAMNKPDNLVRFVDRYVVVENGDVVYNGKDVKRLNQDTAIHNFVELANEKGAKLQDYKDANDLLKAIYRSVQ